MISLRNSSPLARLVVFSGAVAIIGAAGCESPVAPPASRSIAGSSSAAANISRTQSYGNCADNDDNDDRDDGSCRSGQSQVATNVANFNRTSIAAGNTIWFSAVVQVSGVPKNGATVTATGQTIQFSAGGKSYNLAVPNATIVFSSTATTATSVYSATSNSWTTTVPVSNGNGNGWNGWGWGGSGWCNDNNNDGGGSTIGNVFLTAVSFPVQVALPGNIGPVTWSGSFASNTAGIRVNWEWAASVYTKFPTDYNSLGVKPVDDNQSWPYQNSDNAGTPENEKSFLIDGGTGGGSGWNGYYYNYTNVVCPFVSVVLTADVVVVAPLTLNGAPATTIAAGTAGTFVATLKNNSSTALPIGCTVTIDGTPLSASSVTLGTTFNVNSGSTTTCTFKATLTATNSKNTNHTIVVTAVPPSGYTESDPAQSLTTSVVATVPTVTTLQADVVVTSIQRQLSGTLISLAGAADTVSAGMLDTYVATFQNNTATGPVQVQCNVSVDGAAQVAIGAPISVPASGTATCSFTENLAATVNASTVSPHSIVVTATPVNFVDSNPATSESLTQSIVAGADVIVASPTRLIGTGAAQRVLALSVAANDTAKLASTDTIQALITNAGLVATTVTCTVSVTGGADGVLALLGGLVSGSSPITIQPNASSACQFTIMSAAIGPDNISVTAKPVATAPVDPNLTNNAVSVSITSVAAGAFTDIANAAVTEQQVWTVNSGGTLIDRSTQQSDLSQLTMLVTQTQAVLGTFSLTGSVVNSAGDTLSSGTTGLLQLLASSNTNPLCQQVVVPYAKNFTQTTLSICANQNGDSANFQAVSVTYNEEQNGDVANQSAAQIFSLPASNTVGYDSLTFDVTLNFTITGAASSDFAHAKVIAFVTKPSVQSTDQSGDITYQSGPYARKATLVCTGAPLVCTAQ